MGPVNSCMEGPLSTWKDTLGIFERLLNTLNDHLRNIGVHKGPNILILVLLGTEGSFQLLIDVPFL